MVKRTNHELFSGFSSINVSVTDSDAVKKKKLRDKRRLLESCVGSERDCCKTSR